MNKNIKELANEAGLLTYNPEGVPTKFEKFAELVVQKCASLIEAQDVSPAFKLRMKELEKQCWNHQTNHLDTEKFAGIIVQECASIIEAQDVSPAFKLRMFWAVKKYFGVEE